MFYWFVTVHFTVKYNIFVMHYSIIILYSLSTSAIYILLRRRIWDVFWSIQGHSPYIRHTFGSCDVFFIWEKHCKLGRTLNCHNTRNACWKICSMDNLSACYCNFLGDKINCGHPKIIHNASVVQNMTLQAWMDWTNVITYFKFRKSERW